MSLNMKGKRGATRESNLAQKYKASGHGTTVMIRNIPTNYTQDELIFEVCQTMGSQDLFDFFYLPWDSQNNCNVGYSFINFHDSTISQMAVRVFSSYRFRLHESSKVGQVSSAHIQGLENNLRHLQDRAVVHGNLPFSPVVMWKGQKIDLSIIFQELKTQDTMNKLKERAAQSQQPGQAPAMDPGFVQALDRSMAPAPRPMPGGLQLTSMSQMPAHTPGQVQAPRSVDSMGLDPRFGMALDRSMGPRQSPGGLPFNSMPPMPAHSPGQVQAPRSVDSMGPDQRFGHGFGSAYYDQGQGMSMAFDGPATGAPFQHPGHAQVGATGLAGSGPCFESYPGNYAGAGNFAGAGPCFESSPGNYAGTGNFAGPCFESSPGNYAGTGNFAGAGPCENNPSSFAGAGNFASAGPCYDSSPGSFAGTGNFAATGNFASAGPCLNNYPGSYAGAGPSMPPSGPPPALQQANALGPTYGGGPSLPPSAPAPPLQQAPPAFQQAPQAPQLQAPQLQAPQLQAPQLQERQLQERQLGPVFGGRRNSEPLLPNLPAGHSFPGRSAPGGASQAPQAPGPPTSPASSAGPSGGGGGCLDDLFEDDDPPPGLPALEPSSEKPKPVLPPRSAPPEGARHQEVAAPKSMTLLNRFGITGPLKPPSSAGIRRGSLSCDALPVVVDAGESNAGSSTSGGGDVASNASTRLASLAPMVMAPASAPGHPMGSGLGASSHIKNLIEERGANFVPPHRGAAPPRTSGLVPPPPLPAAAVERLGGVAAPGLEPPGEVVETGGGEGTRDISVQSAHDDILQRFLMRFGD